MPPPIMVTSIGRRVALTGALEYIALTLSKEGTTVERRHFLATAGAAVAAAVTPIATLATSQGAGAAAMGTAKGRFRSGLVAYSYQKALAAKTMTYEDLI